MKKMLLLTFCIMSLILGGCKSSSYPNLKDGLYADIQTNKGNMLVELYYKQTPVTVANFVSLAEGKNTYVVDSLKNKPYYDGTIFHRVIKEFMIQGGDPTGTGMGNPGYKFGDEIVDTLRFTKKGQLAMANAGPATNGSQFFITQVPTDWLNGNHTIFGQVVQGEAIIDTIANVETNATNKPISDVIIKKIEIIRQGKEAKNFNATKVFEQYMKEQDELARKREQEQKVLKDRFLAEIKDQLPQATQLPSGVKVFVIKKGEGQKPTHEQNVLVNYAGFLATDGSLFDSNEKAIAEEYRVYDQRRDAMKGYQPFPIPFNQSAQLIPGFREALLTMSVGDRVRAFIPSALAYGEMGAGDIIPPNSDLVFDIEITGIAQ